jgi:hypothetical protein
LGEPPRDRDFFKIEVTEPANDFHRPKGSLPIPTANRRHRHAQQFR